MDPMKENMLSQTPAAKEAEYVPEMAVIERIVQISPLEKLFTVRLESGLSLEFDPGQFIQVWLPGIGEAPISISSPPTQKDNFELCIRKIGNVTGAIHEMSEGERIGIRGPFGRGFDVAAMKGLDVLFIAGGIGLAPLRSLIKYLLEKRSEFGTITLLYGAKTPSDRIFKDELNEWERREDFKTIYTVDKGESGWEGRIGLLTMFFEELEIDPERTHVLLCGPPVMYKFVLLGLRRFRIPPERVILSLERRMRCGVGKCGHCQINNKYVCRDGPKFSWAELRTMEEAI